jgi:hypothetical protein
MGTNPYYPHGVTDSNLCAKLRNALSELDFAAHLTLIRRELPSSFKNGIEDALFYVVRGEKIGQANDALSACQRIKEANNHTANAVFYAANKTSYSIMEKLRNGPEPEKTTMRLHAIPKEVWAYARDIQTRGTVKPAGKNKIATLPEVYTHMAKSGYGLILSGEVTQPVFTEIGKPDGSMATRISFDDEFDSELRQLKLEAESGAYQIAPYKEISLISLFVNLMQVYVSAQTK